MPRTLLAMAEQFAQTGIGVWPWWALSDAEVAEVAALMEELR